MGNRRARPLPVVLEDQDVLEPLVADQVEVPLLVSGLVAVLFQGSGVGFVRERVKDSEPDGMGERRENTRPAGRSTARCIAGCSSPDGPDTPNRNGSASAPQRHTASRASSTGSDIDDTAPGPAPGPPRNRTLPPQG